MFLIFIHNL